MKIAIIIFLLSLSCSVLAQKSLFVRVYDLTGKRISKGHVLMVTDTSLQLAGKAAPMDIPTRNIGFIKTKRSGGNNVLIGSVAGLVTIAIIGAASSSDDSGFFEYSAAEGAAAGALVGLPIGAAIGGLTILLKNSRHYSINGDVSKLKAFQEMVNGKPN